MPDYRRWYVPGGTLFFTLVTHRRKPFLCDDAARHILRGALEDEAQRRSFEIHAMVLLPDHMHAILSLPSGDADYSTRWSAIKGQFSREWLAQGGWEGTITVGRRREERRGVWQPRFIEHTIEDEDDVETHFDYIHYNPVKHGYAKSPKDWPWSTFHKYVKLGVYPEGWGRDTIEFLDVEEELLG